MNDRSTLFVDGPVEAARVADSDDRQTKSLLWLWSLLALAAIAAIGIAISIYASRPTQVDARAIAQREENQLIELSELTEGEQAEVVDKGESAEARNDKIPFTTLALEKVAGFTQLSAKSPAYGTALKCMTQAIYYEAAHEPTQGKRAVAQVVLNRMRHPAYPNSVCGVVYEGVHRPVCQFSFTCDGSLLRAPAPSLWASAESIARDALAGMTEPSVGTATHYHADYVLPRWAFTLAKMQKIGRHIFYRFPGRGGSANALHARWNGDEIIPGLDMERLQAQLAANEDGVLDPAEEFVPGTTVVADVKDRHAANDVGGRLDTTKEWRLSIPDPVRSSGAYNSARGSQGETVESPTDAASNPAIAAAERDTPPTP